VPNQSNNVPIIGFDAEWQYDQQTQRNHILSYQFAGRAKGKTWSGIIYTKGARDGERLDATLASFHCSRKVGTLFQDLITRV
jgi:hypothetical protein